MVAFVKKTLHTVALHEWKIFDQLHLEEILLRLTSDNFFIWNKDTTERAIVMGFSAKPADLLNMSKVKRDNIPVIRRYTGGGTVIVDESTLFASFIMNNTDADTQPYPREIMAWSEKIYAPAFNNAMPEKDGIQFQLREHDYVIGDKKIGGNAQSIIKNRWIHHTSFLWNFNGENMEYLQLPKKRPEYRQSRKHTDFLLPISTRLSSIELLERNIFHELAKHYNLKPLTEQEIIQKASELKVINPEFQCRTKREDLSEYPVE
eukprot:gene13159-14442_t